MDSFKKDLMNNARFFFMNEKKEVSDIPLKDIEIEIDVVEDAYEAKFIQEYENQNNFSIETYYKYPVYPKASLINVKVLTDEYEIECFVKEKKEASIEYKEAIKHGEQAVLVSEETEEMYRCCLI